MYPTHIAKQLIDFQKATFDNIFSAMVLVQEQSETMTHVLFEQVSWLPEESKRIVDQWFSMNKKGRDELKTAVDDNFNNVIELLQSK